MTMDIFDHFEKGGVESLFEAMKSQGLNPTAPDFIDILKRQDGKVPVKRQVTRDGKTFQQTFWVNPADVPDETSGGNNLYQRLLNMGFVEKLDHLPEDTQKAHQDENGNYTEERKKLHREIKDKFLSQGDPVPPDKTPTAVLTMGGAGSGKSSATRGMDFTDFVPIDPDGVKKDLPEYDEAVKGRALNAAMMAHEESSDVAKQIRAEAINTNRNVLVDGTGANLNKMSDLVSHLKEKGYHVSVIMPHIPLEEGKSRIAKRAEKTGRFVPDHVAEDQYTKIPYNFTQLADMADDAKLYNNEGSEAVLMYSKSADEGEQVHHPNFYEQFQKVAKPYS